MRHYRKLPSAGDHGDFRQFAALALYDFAGPAFIEAEEFGGDEKPEAVAFLIGPDQIIVAIFVEIDKTHSVVAPTFVHD